jgi:hypothetical protein
MGYADEIRMLKIKLNAMIEDCELSEITEL